MNSMNIRRTWGVALATILMVLASNGVGAEPATTNGGTTVTASPHIPIVAIFVRNANVKQLDGKVDALEALVGSRATEKGYSILSRADALNAVASMAKDGANTGDPDQAGAKLDKILSNNTSALALARNMGADYLLICTAISYGQNKKAYAGDGIETTIVTTKLRLSYTMLDVVKGATVPGAGGTVEASKSTRIDKNSAEEVDVINDLMDDAAGKLVEKMPAPPTSVAPATDANAITINCNIQGLTLLDIVRNDKGEYEVTNTPCPVRATNATVELDGVIIGTATGTFKDVSPGLHKIRVTCKGSQDWNDYEGTVKIHNGMTLDIDLHLSDKGYARWKELTDMVYGLKTGTKITDSTAEAIRGLAQMLRQSGFKFDIKQDTKEGTQIKNQADKISIYK